MLIKDFVAKKKQHEKMLMNKKLMEAKQKR